jgi:hypothetical protein
MIQRVKRFDGDHLLKAHVLYYVLQLAIETISEIIGPHRRVHLLLHVPLLDNGLGTGEFAMARSCQLAAI